MKLSLPLKIATISASASVAIAPLQAVNATEFGEFAVDQNKFIAVAVPFNYKQYKLAIIEQVPGKKSCWQESGNSPTTIDLSLLNFDHTDHCRKAVDTNGYSLRHNGVDDKVEFTLDLRVNNGQLQLVADHQDPSRQDMVLGSTNGIVEAPMKIELAPGWQFTKRLYEGGAIQHIYVSDNPSPQVMANVETHRVTNDPADPNQTATLQEQPLPTGEQVATQTQTNANAQTPATNVEGFVQNVLTPLSQALYNTYNSLFTTETQSQPNNSGQ